MKEKKSLFSALLGKVLGEKKEEVKKSSHGPHIITKKKSPEELKKEEAAKAAQAEARRKEEEEVARKAEEAAKKRKEEEIVEEGDGSATASRFGDKFKKDGIKKPKSLREIAEEAEKKSKEMEGKAFSESDAALKDLKKAEEGHSKFVKKKTKKALEGKVFLIRGKDDGRPAWHYVLVSPEKIKALRQQQSGTNIDVTDFGKIIRSGWGENPSDDIVKEIEEEYGD